MERVQIRGRHGGVEKRGGWKTSGMTPLPKGVLDPPSHGAFSTPLKCPCSVFPVQKIQSRPEALLEGSKSFRESAFSGTFSSPHMVCTPISRPNQNLTRVKN